MLQHVNNEVRRIDDLPPVWTIYKVLIWIASYLIFSLQTSCTLTLFNITDENIILSIRLPHDPKLSNIELLRLEKVSGFQKSMIIDPSQTILKILEDLYSVCIDFRPHDSYKSNSFGSFDITEVSSVVC